MQVMRKILLVVLFLHSIPQAAFSQGIPFDQARLEVGFFEDRLQMYLTQTATLVQQFLGFTVTANLPFLGTDFGTGEAVRLDWTAAVETGLSFDATGLARWFVRNVEQDILNQKNGTNDPAPGLTADLIFGLPLYLPLRLRTELELTLGAFWSIQLGAEFAAAFLIFAPDLAEVKTDFGFTIGFYFQISRGFGLGLRGRLTAFGDGDARWPGFGANLYLAIKPFTQN